MGADDVSRLGAATVVVVGDVMLDVYVEGQVSRISPEAPVPVLRHASTREVLGGAANVASNVASLGGRALLIGRVGVDGPADRVGQLCADMGVDTSLLRRDGDVPTVTKTRLVAGWQQIARVDRETTTPLSDEGRAQLLLDVAQTLDGLERAVVVLSDYAKGLLTADVVRSVIELCQRRDVPVVVDPKGDDPGRYAGATVVKPNLSEATTFAGGRRVGLDGHHDRAAACLAATGARNVVVSLGEHGLVEVGDELESPLHAASHAVEVADVSGAGDAMVAVLAMGLAVALPFPATVRLANVAAAIVCGKPGTAAVQGVELVDMLDRDLAPARVLGAVPLASAVEGADRVRAAGGTVVFTNGCFDLLHAGHVRLLRQARAQGDYLIVGLNGDASVRRLKGPTRPLQEESDRAEIVAALAGVDCVVVFHGDTPLDEVLALRPDVLVKGGDYVAEDVAGGKEMRAWGGRVHLVPVLDGRSTTRLAEAGAAGSAEPAARSAG